MCKLRDHECMNPSVLAIQEDAGPPWRYTVLEVIQYQESTLVRLLRQVRQACQATVLLTGRLSSKGMDHSPSLQSPCVHFRWLIVTRPRRDNVQRLT